MKIRKKYTLYINEMLGVATYGNDKFSDRISNASIGQIYDCTFSQLKNNLNFLIKKGYTINKKKY